MCGLKLKGDHIMNATAKKETAEAPTRQYCSFRISQRLYGVNILEVKEISPVVDCTPIFHAAKEIKGYVNIRGQIYLLLDLRLILGFEAKEIDAASRSILFRSEVGESFAILVDRIDDIHLVAEEQIENRRTRDDKRPENLERRGVDIAEGVCKLDDELLIILNARNLLTIASGLKTDSDD